MSSFDLTEQSETVSHKFYLAVSAYEFPEDAWMDWRLDSMCDELERMVGEFPTKPHFQVLLDQGLAAIAKRTLMMAAGHYPSPPF